jgi:hypothetical protein
LASNLIDRRDKFGHGRIGNGFVLLAKSDYLFARIAQTKFAKSFCYWRKCGGKDVDGFDPMASLKN